MPEVITDQEAIKPGSYQEYRSEHEQQMAEILGDFGKATNVVDLRRAWSRNSLAQRSAASYVGHEVFKAFGDRLQTRLAEMGLDLNSQDERIALLRDSIRVIVPDNLGSVEFSDVGPHIFRLLTGSDPQVKDRITLRPLENLVDVSYPIEDKALKYTADSKYAVFDHFPRKASRTETDPESDFWGFGITTDTWPGERYNGHSGPNVALWMPTGLISREEIIRTADDHSGEGHVMKRKPLYVPERICAQSLTLGRPYHGERQTDTTNRLVQRFLETIK